MSLFGRFLHARSMEKSTYTSKEAIDHARQMPEMAMRRRGAQAIGKTLLAGVTVLFIAHSAKSCGEVQSSQINSAMAVSETEAARCSTLYADIPNPKRNEFQQACRNSTFEIGEEEVVIAAFALPEMPSSADNSWCQEIEIEPGDGQWTVAQRIAPNYGLSGAETKHLADEIATELGLVDEQGNFKRQMQKTDELGLCVAIQPAA